LGGPQFYCGLLRSLLVRGLIAMAYDKPKGGEERAAPHRSLWEPPEAGAEGEGGQRDAANDALVFITLLSSVGEPGPPYNREEREKRKGQGAGRCINALEVLVEKKGVALLEMEGVVLLACLQSRTPVSLTRLSSRNVRPVRLVRSVFLEGRIGSAE